MNLLHTSLLGLVTLAAPAVLSAQTLNEHCAKLGNTDNTAFYRRGGVGNSVGYDALVSRRDFRGWGADTNNQTAHRIDGVRAVIGDVDGGTSENVDIWIYPEDTANPGNPNFAASAGGVAFDLFGNGVPGQAQAFVFDLVFPSPFVVDNGGEVFLEAYFDGQRAPEAHMALLYGDDLPGETRFDIANRRTGDTGHGVGTGGYAFAFDVGNAASFALPAQALIAPLCADQPGLALGVSTNQSSLPGSIAPAMSASWFSALQPCDVVDREGNPRADNFGLFWSDGRFTSGETVRYYLAITGLNGAPLPIDQFVPGSSGQLCLDTAFSWVELGQQTTNANGASQLMFQIPATARGSLQGLDFAYQAFIINFVAARIEGSNCALQQW